MPEKKRVTNDDLMLSIGALGKRVDDLTEGFRELIGVVERMAEGAYSDIAGGGSCCSESCVCSIDGDDLANDDELIELLEQVSYRIRMSFGYSDPWELL